MIGDWWFARSLRALARSPEGALAAYGSASWPDARCPAGEAPLCALDFELDGLDDGAHVLQAGWVPFEGRRLRLDGAQVCDIRSRATLNDGAVAIHGIGEQRAAAGRPVKEALRALLPDIAGRIVIAHGASIERAALRRLAANAFGVSLPVRTICTLALERRLHPGLVGTAPYRLGAARRRYGLPVYPPHDALSDAMAAAELFLAQLTRLPADIRLVSLEAR